MLRLLTNELLLNALKSTSNLQELTPEPTFSGEPASIPDEYLDFTGFYDGAASFTPTF